MGVSWDGWMGKRGLDNNVAALSSHTSPSTSTSISPYILLGMCVAWDGWMSTRATTLHNNVAASPNHKNKVVKEHSHHALQLIIHLPIHLAEHGCNMEWMRIAATTLPFP
jgi:hypothetical protein